VSGRRLTTAVTLTVLLLLLIGMAAYGYTQLTAPLPERPSAEEKCTGAEKEVQGFLKRKQVQVSVFNAGNREGFAGATLEKIVDAGFPDSGLDRVDDRRHPAMEFSRDFDGWRVAGAGRGGHGVIIVRQRPFR
jgi:hypothetical protein